MVLYKMTSGRYEFITETEQRKVSEWFESFYYNSGCSIKDIHFATQDLGIIKILEKLRFESEIEYGTFDPPVRLKNNEDL